LIPVSVSVAPLKDEQGQIVGGIETFRDESSRIQDQTLAKAVQRHFLPDGMPELPGVHLSAEYHPHDMIGGDYYDVRELDDGRLFLAVMDVSGHGVASALFTTFLNGLVSRFSHMTGTPGAFITAINAKLADVVGSSRFVTAFACVYDVRKQTLTWSSGGHPSPVRLSQHGEQLTGFQADGPPLGIAKNMIYPENETRLESGELLVFYTDGASELRNESGEMFGLNGMAALSAQVMRIGRENLAGRLYTRLLEESSDIDQPDDITLVALSVD